jgi:protein phosphatase
MARILLLSDIHGNLPALRTVLNVVDKWDEVLVLGDLVDYGPHPGEVIDEIRRIGARVVRGNHDHAVGYGVDCRCSDETHWLSVWFRENVTLKLLGEGDKQYLAQLPLKLRIGDTPEILAVHAAPSNPLYEYLHPWLGDDELCAKLSPHMRLYRLSHGNQCPRGVYLIGHTHHQFLRMVRGTLIINPGSVGQPRDGDNRASYALLDTETGQVVLGRVKYDIDTLLRALEALRIPEPYMSALRHLIVKAEVPPRRPETTTNL